MNVKIYFLALAAASGFAGSLAAADPSLAGVQQKIRQETGRGVAWQRDDAERRRAQADVRAALRRPLTLAAAVQVALNNNQGLQATFEEIGLAFANLRQARMVANPELDFAAKFPDRAPSGTKLEWEVAQNFMDLVMLPMRARVARHQLSATQLRVADEVVKLVAEVKAAYYTLQADEATLVRLREMSEAQQASLEYAHKLHAAGNIPELRLVQEQAARGQARLKVSVAEAEAREHREKLNRLLGLSGADLGWRLAGTLPPVPPTDLAGRNLEAIAIANRLDLSAARAEVDTASASLHQEKTWRFLPALSIGIIGEREPDGTNLVGPVVRLPLPIFDTGSARVTRGEAKVRMAERKMDQLAVNLQSEVRELRDRMTSKRATARFYQEDVLPARKRILALTLLNYNAMITGAFELFAAKQELSEAEQAYLAVTRDYWIARAELERAVGGDLAGRRIDDAKNSQRGIKPN